MHIKVFFFIMTTIFLLSACSEHSNEEKNQSSVDNISIGDRAYWDLLKRVKQHSAFICQGVDRKSNWSCSSILVPKVIDNKHAVVELIELTDKSPVYAKLAISIKMDLTENGICYIFDDEAIDNLKLYYSANKRVDFNEDSIVNDDEPYIPFSRSNTIKAQKKSSIYNKKICDKLFLSDGKSVSSVSQMEDVGNYLVKTFYNGVVQNESQISIWGTSPKSKDRTYYELRASS